jgi:adenosylcobinamide kinase / adenosylcobinamide-phosphate guanylyltransferase
LRRDICSINRIALAKVIYISGGERSGKSSFAQKMALSLSASPVYLATARIWDDDFRQRIQHHKDERGACWTNIEEEKELSRHAFDGQTVLLDCVTLWLTNFYADAGFEFEPALEQAKAEWDKLILNDFTLIIVSNEIGMGLHAPDAGARKFVELQGRMNQYIASVASEAYFMVSGISLKIK